MSVRIAAGGDAGEAITRVVPRLVDERVASRLAAQDPDLWGPDAAAGAARRLGWTEAVADARPLVAEVAELRARHRAAGLDRVVLCGAGGSSIAAQVIAATQGVPLEALDAAGPDSVRGALAGPLATTAVVVVSQSGATVETDAHRRSFEQAFRDAGIDPADRIVVVTDPGTPLDTDARAAGYRVFAESPAVSGRFAALTASALVPAGLAGADLGELLDEAESELLDLAIDAPTNNALVLAAALAGANPRRDAIVLVADGTHLVGFGEWVEHLLAGCTGKAGTGLIPVVVERDAPELRALPAGAQVLRFVADATDDRHDDLLAAGELLLSGTLGELLLVLEHAAAVTARLMGVDPFDEPDLADVGARIDALLRDGGTDEPPSGSLDALLAAVPENGYVAVSAYVDPATYAGLRDLRDALARRTGRPATFGWGPRSLRTTGQLHRGGPATGAFLVLTADAADGDLPVPGRPYGYAALERALAAADADDLAARGRPVVRLHLTGPADGSALIEEVDR